MRTPECHPEARHKGNGLCVRCYARELAKKHRDKNRARSRAWYAENREKAIADAVEWARNHTGKHRATVLKYRYGLTPEQEAILLLAQGFHCPICNEPLVERITVDHDHATGEIRGLLHNTCNAALGFLRDDPDRATRAAEYLRRPIGPEVLS